MYEIIYGVVPCEKISLSEAELTARLGRPASESDTEVLRAKKELISSITAKYAAVRVEILECKKGEVKLSPFSLKSLDAAKYFSSCDATYVFMATLGIEADRLIMKKKHLSIFEGFLYDAVASAMIEAVCDAAERKIRCGGEKTKNRFSPGYGDVPLSLQKDFIKLLSADKLMGVSLTESMLMIPQKTVSAFIGRLK